MALHSVEAGLTRIRPSMDDAARALGRRPERCCGGCIAPMLRGSLLTALLLVFVDVLKELPATLILEAVQFQTRWRCGLTNWPRRGGWRIRPGFALAIVLCQHPGR